MPVQHFPCRIGRSSSDDIVIEDAGVWSSHATLQISSTLEIECISNPSSITRINGKPVTWATLHNGDLLELGAVRMWAFLAPAPLPSSRLREAVFWVVVILVLVAQMLLMFRLA